MKGIILAGGAGTRLYPVTKVICKQLLPVYDKPMVYYPLSTLMLAGIREILIISTPKDLPRIEDLLGDGSNYGISIKYKVQEHPKGIAEAFIIGEEFIASDDVCLILGDNIFYGHGLPKLLLDCVSGLNGATVFGYYVKDPQRYGIIEFDNNGKVISFEEKPAIPKSNYAIVGLYLYNNEVIQIAKSLIPSSRGELEITDINLEYLNKGKIRVELMGRGYAWLDVGTHNSIMEASTFIKTIEDRQGLKISCIEEIAYRMGYIDEAKLRKIAESLLKSGYGEYLLRILKD